MSLALAVVLFGVTTSGHEAQSTVQGPVDGSTGCLRCHEGIEEMHPVAELSCVDCHGGDAAAFDKLRAHVVREQGHYRDERVPPQSEDLAWRRFINPMDLRVVDRTCGECHPKLTRSLVTSLHGTTAGHLSDGYYEVGLTKEKGQSPYGVFPVFPHESEPGEIDRLVRVPRFEDQWPVDELATHFTDLVRKECMQCHLYSQGRAVRGRVGYDGDYRGEGCAACHVEYALDGLSISRDRKSKRHEPGHPLRHTMRRQPTTQACTSCHYGDASIGLHYRGLSQLPPGAVGGPDVPGTTDAPLNRAYYMNDKAIVPPDVHHEKGMHCIDCHTISDVMGDGNLHGNMEYAVEITCESCHGDFESPSDLKSERGTPLEHLFRRGDDVFLRSKVTGKEHPIPQVVHVLDPGRREYNPRAVAAMTGEHGKLECYTCHAGWNANFIGFHFDRNETLTQLDLISGLKTPGRVTTQEKVFATWKGFYAGLNEAGRVSPYLTGFSMMGSVTDKNGDRVLDQVMPVTTRGLSGLTMVHHQLHSTRPTARSCVECHRSSATWGMGSVNFRLARQLAFVADRRGIEVLALDRSNLSASLPLAKIVLPDVIDLEILSDPLQGYARFLFAAEGGRGIHVIDVQNPTSPRRVGFVATVNPRSLVVRGTKLYCADGIGGLRVFDISRPEAPVLLAVTPMFDAHAIAVQWPFAYVADGPGGLSIVDIRAPIAPRVVGGTPSTRSKSRPSAALDVSVLFQYSRPTVDERGNPSDHRTEARLLCVVLDERSGPMLVDVTEATHPRVLYPDDEPRSTGRTNLSHRGIVLASHVDLASSQGGGRTNETDYLYLLTERTFGNGNSASVISVLDVGDPRRPRRVAQAPAGSSTEMLSVGSFYNQPFLQRVALVPGSQGVNIIDLSISAEPTSLGSVQALGPSYVVAIEEFPLDRMLDEDGRPLKDVSHAESRWLYRAEIERVLGVSGHRLGTLDAEEVSFPIPGGTARMHFSRVDSDRSGLLEGDEYLLGGGERVDISGDGRISLTELATSANVMGLVRETVVSAPSVISFDDRSSPNGDLARLLDGVDPYAHDKNGNHKLSRREFENVFFDALDIDGDGRLSFDELSRHPGELRQLRYRDAWARSRFDEVDDNHNGFIGRREFDLREKDFVALDDNGDGEIQLTFDDDQFAILLGGGGANDEWPVRRRVNTGLPPVFDHEVLLARFDSDGNGSLSQRELSSRRDLLTELDNDEDSAVSLAELQAVEAIIANGGVETVPDDFIGRWDLDGDGKVERGEFPEGRLPPRLRGLVR